MLLSEFENLTDIHPDCELYRAIEHEYNTGEWTSKAQFCNAYKFNEGSLAVKIQSAANSRLIAAEEQRSADRVKLQKLDDANRVLESHLAEAGEENAELEKEIAVMRKVMQELREGGIMADMFRSMRRALHGGTEADELLHMMRGYDYLLEEMEKEGKS
jgi:hypothetical protein